MVSAIEQAFRIPKALARQAIARNLSVAEIAAKSGLGVRTVERAMTPGMTGTVETLIKIATTLGGEVSVNFDEKVKK